MATRLLAIAAGAALLAAGASVDFASAQDQACKPDLVTATGRAKFRPFTKTKELEGRGSAMKDAVKAWQRQVAEMFGDRWDNWSRAVDTSYHCEPNRPGKIIAGSFIGCTISGRPCAAADSEGGGGPSAENGGSSDGSGSRSADNWETPRTTWSPAYKRAMAYQERLANARERAQERGWRREEARQAYLARQRERAEAWAQERAEARVRYYYRND